MARPEPNIFSQKCGKACAGAFASTSITSPPACAVAADCARTRSPLTAVKHISNAIRTNRPVKELLLKRIVNLPACRSLNRFSPRRIIKQSAPFCYFAAFPKSPRALAASLPVWETTRQENPMARPKSGALRAISATPAAPGVTLKALAQHLQLSPATVSLVINRSPAAKSIPQRTQERIRTAARELKYYPNFVARSLRAQRSFTIGVVVPEISEGYAALVMSGIEDHLLQEGYFYF